MKVSEARKLKTGDLVKLTDTGAIFEVFKVDDYDSYMPLMLKLKQSIRPVISYVDRAGWIETIEEGANWIFAKRENAIKASDKSEEKFNEIIGECYFVSVDQLEKIEV